MKKSKFQESLRKDIEEAIRLKNRKKIDEIYERIGLSLSGKPVKFRPYTPLCGTKADVVFSDDLFDAEKEAQNEGSD